jgi:hypothetical protein
MSDWFSQSWTQGKCLECDSIFWLCEGDPSDVTAYRADAIKCWKCEHIMYRLSEDDLGMMYGDDWKDEVNSNYEETYKSPIRGFWEKRLECTKWAIQDWHYRIKDWFNA